MNKRDVINDISEETEINVSICSKVIDSLETVLSDKLEESEGVRRAFDKIHVLLDMIRDKEDHPIFDENELFDKLANSSGATKMECIEIVNALIDILNDKIEISKSAKIKFDLVYKLTNFFRH